MTKAKELFTPPTKQSLWERTKSEALHILDEQANRRRMLGASLKEARLARDAESGTSLDVKPKGKTKSK